MPQQPKKRGVGWWLGRQVGHVKKAIATPVPAKETYRRKRVQEQAHPTDPNVTLRRVVTDELIIKKDNEPRP